MTHDNRLATLLQASLIADSLALPVHWNYDPAVIASEYGRVVELRSPPVKGYHGGQPAGGQTHYGAQALALMDSLGAGHTFDETAFAATWRALWDHYDGYRDGATKATLANLDAGTPAKSAGSTSTDLGGASRIPPLLVAMSAEADDAVIAAAQAQTAMTHRHPVVMDAAAFMVRATRSILRGSSIEDALAEAAAAPYQELHAAVHFDAARAAVAKGGVAAVQSLGAACAVGAAFPATLALALAHPTDLEAALIENAMAGGDSASRGLFLGMLLGASSGAIVPQRWLTAWQANSRVAAFLSSQSLALR